MRAATVEALRGCEYVPFVFAWSRATKPAAVGIGSCPPSRDLALLRDQPTKPLRDEVADFTKSSRPEYPALVVDGSVHPRHLVRAEEQEEVGRHLDGVTLTFRFLQLRDGLDAAILARPVGRIGDQHRHHLPPYRLGVRQRVLDHVAVVGRGQKD